MTNLKLFLLGTPHLERDGQAAHIERHKALALSGRRSNFRKPIQPFSGVFPTEALVLSASE